MRTYEFVFVDAEAEVFNNYEVTSERKKSMKVTPILAIILALSSVWLQGCSTHASEEHHDEQHQTILVTSPLIEDVVVTQPYVCQIRSRRNIEIKALEGGYLEKIDVKEGQLVKKDDELFKVVPILYKARFEAEKAEVDVAEIKWRNLVILAEGASGPDKIKVVSEQQVLIALAELERARAKMRVAAAELNFATIKAPFDGIIDRLYQQQGSLIKEGEVLTTLSDNSVMWVYFNVPEARYLEDMATPGKDQDVRRIELVLADGQKFHHDCTNLTIEAQFNNQTGNIKYRADFPNPSRLLRHGQTGNILIHRTLKDAMVIPQRATFEILDKRYVWVLDKDNFAHQRLIEKQFELDDIFVIKKSETEKVSLVKEGEEKTAEHKEKKKGLEVTDKIILEGVRDVHEGMKVEYHTISPEEALKNQKQHAE